MQQQSQWLHVAENILAYQAAFQYSPFNQSKVSTIKYYFIPSLFKLQTDDNGQDHNSCYERLHNISFYAKYIVSKPK